MRLGGISMVLALLNILCIIFTAVFMFKVSESSVAVPVLALSCRAAGEHLL